MEDDVGLLQRAQRIEREQPGIARAGTHERDGAAALVRRGLQQALAFKYIAKPMEPKDVAGLIDLLAAK